VTKNGSPSENPKNDDTLSINEIKSKGSSWQNLDFDQVETRLTTFLPYSVENWCKS